MVLPLPTTKAKQRVWLDDIILRLGDILRPDHPILRDLRLLRAELHNHGPEERAKATSRPYTPDLVDRIRAMRRAFPDMPQHEIAKVVDTNQGRVNNALRGVRE